MPFQPPTRAVDTAKYETTIRHQDKQVYLVVSMQALDNGTTEADWDQVFLEFVDLIDQSGTFIYESEVTAGAKSWMEGSNVIPTSWVEPDPGDDE